MEQHELITNGTRRIFEGKRFGNEFRVYRVMGDVSDRAELAEAAQELAIETGCDNVLLKI